MTLCVVYHAAGQLLRTPRETIRERIVLGCQWETLPCMLQRVNVRE